ncbi:undecaprenyl-diphosphatase [Isoptericola jiangsuensis]|uniref:Undecaprenyl-diphosphatase n=1 Tax=Isoptericola jiangsuensis TaxID=548579 RepID=A0A2A9EQX3_9MICO|nr:phosphatase PAP2 family protein [Isoptericola jiangsuensis]PFG41527.1 undecaprenyl-diphosphatase [Isoptericola jiangsuensis]
MPSRATRTRTQALTRAVAWGLAGFVPFLVLAWLVRTNGALHDADQAVVDAAVAVTVAHPALHTFWSAWSAITQPGLVIAAGALLALWTWRRHGLASRSLWAVVTLAVSWGLVQLAKLLVARVRPLVDDALLDAPGYSFPSGHATSAATAAVTLTLLVWPLLGRRGRVVVPVVATLFALLTCADRIFLGVHFPTDVVAGLLLGTVVSVSSYLGYRGWNPSTGTAAPEA